MSRLAARFNALKSANRKGLITFVMAGDPSADATLDILHGLVKNGADILELGVPFSDPMADGPTIQAAAKRALDAGMTLEKTLKIVEQFRTQDKETPIVLMGYYNPVFRYGVERFSKDASVKGVDGIIIVDVPPEESAEVIPHLKAQNIDFVRLLAPTTPPERASDIMREASGFIYCIAVTGVTGAKSADFSRLKESFSFLERRNELPIAIGFGIKTPEQAKAASTIGDAVVVGSSLVDLIGKNPNDFSQAFALTKQLAEALR